MLKKFGMVSAGVTAALLAAAPLASAGEATDSGHDSDHGHHKSHDNDHHKRHGGQNGEENISCHFAGGDASAEGRNAPSLANALVQAPVAGNNIANALDCSNILNHALDDNFSGNQIAIL